MTTLVRARSVKKQYGSVTALRDVSFEVSEGITGLLGTNGAGKTTMLGLIIGLHERDGGTLEVLGQDPWKAGADVRERLGYAPEHHTLPPSLRADDFVRQVAELHGLPAHEARTRAAEALWLVGLGEERFRALGTMSTGQRQRVKLAQAIAHDPSLILLDEPTDGLDPFQRDSMLEMIRSISDDFGINVILSSHLLGEVEQICDGAVIIGDGGTIASGSVEELQGATGSFVTFELDASTEDAAAVADALEKYGLIASSDGRLVSTRGSQDDDDNVYDAIRDTCAERGLGIVRLHQGRRTLEEVFIEETA